MDEQVERKKQRDFASEIDPKLFKKWKRRIDKDHPKIRHKNILRYQHGLNGNIINQVFNSRMATERVLKIVTDYFENLDEQ